MIRDTAAWHLFLTLKLPTPRLGAWPAESGLRDLGPGTLLPGPVTSPGRDSAGAIQVPDELALNSGEDMAVPGPTVITVPWRVKTKRVHAGGGGAGLKIGVGGWERGEERIPPAPA